MLGLAAFLVVMLSLIMAPQAMAQAPFPDYTTYAQPGETATYDFGVQAPGVQINQIQNTGSCTLDGPTKVKYTVPLSAVVGDPDVVCNIGVIYNGGIPGTATFVIKIGSPPPPPDTIAPVVTITSPADGATLTSNTVTLVYGVTDNSGDIPSCNIPNNYGVPLDVGSNTITVNCTDAAGNTGSDSVAVTYNEPPPPPPPPTGPVKVYISDATVTEPDPGDAAVYAKFKVSLSRTNPTPITLDYGTISLPPFLGTATVVVDYQFTAGKKVIPAGQPANQTIDEIKVKIVADNKKEAAEVFFLLSFSCDQNVEVVNALAKGTIVNDD